MFYLAIVPENIQKKFLRLIRLNMKMPPFFFGDSWNNESCNCLLYTSPSPRDSWASRMPSSAWKKKIVVIIETRNIDRKARYKVTVFKNGLNRLQTKQSERWLQDSLFHESPKKKGGIFILRRISLKNFFCIFSGTIAR